MIQNPEDVDPRNGNGEEMLSEDEHGGLGYGLTPQRWVMEVLKTLKDVDPGSECLEKAVTNCYVTCASSPPSLGLILFLKTIRV